MSRYLLALLILLLTGSGCSQPNPKVKVEGITYGPVVENVSGDVTITNHRTGIFFDVCTAANSYESHLCSMNATRRSAGLPPLQELPSWYKY